MELFCEKGQARDHAGSLYDVTIKVYGRDGTKSPTLWIICLGKKQITPYECKIKKWHLTVPTVLKVSYGNPKFKTAVRDLLFQSNPLLERAK